MRLDVFRLLVQHGQGRMVAGALDVAPNISVCVTAPLGGGRQWRFFRVYPTEKIG
ncbi:MAG: hypothetical protein AABY83_10770 [Pseudomonadota bacterium]